MMVNSTPLCGSYPKLRYGVMMTPNNMLLTLIKYRLWAHARERLKNLSMVQYGKPPSYLSTFCRAPIIPYKGNWNLDNLF